MLIINDNNKITILVGKILLNQYENGLFSEFLDAVYWHSFVSRFDHDSFLFMLKKINALVAYLYVFW